MRPIATADGLSVPLLVCLSVTTVREPCKTLEISFGMWTWACLRNYVLDVVQIPHGKGHF